MATFFSVGRPFMEEIQIAFRRPLKRAVDRPYRLRTFARAINLRLTIFAPLNKPQNSFISRGFSVKSLLCWFIECVRDSRQSTQPALNTISR